RVRAHVLAGCAFAFIFLAPCWVTVRADKGPAQPGPAEATAATSTGSQVQAVVPHPPAAPLAQSGMRLERQLLTPSGNLRIQYLRDRQAGTHQIALQDVHNPANTAVIAQYKRNAWVVVSPNDEWVVLNTRDGA